MDGTRAVFAGLGVAGMNRTKDTANLVEIKRYLLFWLGNGGTDAYAKAIQIAHFQYV